MLKRHPQDVVVTTEVVIQQVTSVIVISSTPTSLSPGSTKPTSTIATTTSIPLNASPPSAAASSQPASLSVLLICAIVISIVLVLLAVTGTIFAFLRRRNESRLRTLSKRSSELWDKPPRPNRPPRTSLFDFMEKEIPVFLPTTSREYH